MSAGRISIPGVYVEVAGLGVLLTGKSGAGKSQLALELVSRGHCLVADDAPFFERSRDGGLEGGPHPELGDFLAVHGVGLLNIRALFGDNAVKSRSRLDLVVRLQEVMAGAQEPLDALLEPPYGERTYLGVTVPELRLMAFPAHNLAITLEAAVRNHRLRLKGYDALQDFAARQKRAMGAAGPARE